MAHATGEDAIVSPHSDWLELRNLIARVKAQSDFLLYSWGLMSNHLHLLTEERLDSPSRFMQKILGPWAQRFNFANDRKGHLFRDRFKSRIVDDERYFRWLLRYIHWNPVDARIVNRPEEWPWSSHREYLAGGGGMTDVEWPLSLFGADAASAVKAFQRFVLQEPEADLKLLPFTDSRLDLKLAERPIAPTSRPPLDELARQAAFRNRLDAEVLFGPHRKSSPVSLARASFALEAQRVGYANTEIGGFLGISRSGVSWMMRRGLERVLGT
ncbi:MAG: transposase [Elusimicrobia bacterium]|nr:transposase [Elusimicrobiota bacterium]